MKKTLIALAIALTGFTTQSFAQKLILKNTTSCSAVEFTVYAHDCNACGCGSLVSSTTISVPIGGSITLNDVTSLNSSPGWSGGVIATGGPGSGWDGVAFNPPGLACSKQIGSSTCISSTPPTLLLSCPCTDWDGIWQFIGGNYVANVTDWN